MHNSDSCWKFSKASEYANVYWAKASKCMNISISVGYATKSISRWKKPCLLLPSARKLDSTKNCFFSNFFFHECNWRFSQVFLSSRVEWNNWNNKPNMLNVLKSCFTPISIKLLWKLNFKNGVWIVQVEHTSGNLHVPFCFWFESWQISANAF